MVQKRKAPDGRSYYAPPRPSYMSRPESTRAPPPPSYMSRPESTRATGSGSNSSNGSITPLFRDYPYNMVGLRSPGARAPSDDTKPNALAQKFVVLEQMIAAVLAEPATEAEWEKALGPGSEQRVEFISTLKELNKAGDLDWMRTPAVPTTPATNEPAKSAIPNTPSSDSEPEPKRKCLWPPALPTISSPSLRTQVFTHLSHSSVQASSAISTDQSNNHYQRLEFLGDATLKYILSKELFFRFPDHREGALSILRSAIESNQNLSHYSTAYDLPSRVKIGKEAIQCGMIKQTKFCADIFEAYIGALVVEDPTAAGFNRVEAWLLKLVEPKLVSSGEEIGDSLTVDRRARERLFLIVGGTKGVKVDYIWEEGGGGNKGGFSYVVRLTGYGYDNLELGRGWGPNKSDAMLRAAMGALGNPTLLAEVRKKKDQFIRGR